MEEKNCEKDEFSAFSRRKGCIIGGEFYAISSEEEVKWCALLV